jgi:hypothetical protein
MLQTLDKQHWRPAPEAEAAVYTQVLAGARECRGSPPPGTTFEPSAVLDGPSLPSGQLAYRLPGPDRSTALAVTAGGARL